MITNLLTFIVIIASGILISEIIQIILLKKMQNKKISDDNKYIQLHMNVNSLKITLIVVSIAIAFLGWNVESKLRKDVFSQVKENMHSLKNIYISKDYEIEVSEKILKEEIKISFDELLKDNGEKLPSFKKVPHVTIQAYNEDFIITEITSTYIKIKWLWQFDGPNIDEMGIDRIITSKIDFWIISND